MLEEIFDAVQQYPDALRAIGVMGFLIYIVSFQMVQLGRLCGNSAAYAACNVVAASCVLVSLIGEFNLASLLIQISFISFGLYGILRRKRMTSKSLNELRDSNTAKFGEIQPAE